jgi:hypothetical protein
MYLRSSFATRDETIASTGSKVKRHARSTARGLRRKRAASNGALVLGPGAISLRTPLLFIVRIARCRVVSLLGVGKIHGVVVHR